METRKTRREFLKEGGGATLALGTGIALLQTGCATTKQTADASAHAAVAPSNQVLMGLIGCGSRGTNVMDDFMALPEVRVIAVCDPDSNRANEFAGQVEKRYQARPGVHKDYRELLENKDLDAVLIATPDHWHCLAMCHAAEAGLDVYVEKPISHSIVEGRAMVNAARLHKRVVQVGTQQRSANHFAEAVALVQSGMLGQITLVRTWNYDYEMPAGLGMGDNKLPAGVDYDFWSGPAPLREFNSNRFHYQWRWFYDYAGGMMCDWGIHLIDIAMWGMKAGAPKFIAASGAKYALPDNRDTPDTLEVQYQFEGTEIAPKGFMLTYSNSKAAARGTRGGQGYGIEFHGSNGSLYVNRSSYEIVPQEIVPPEGGDKNNKRLLLEPKKRGGQTANIPHIKNFLECVKSRQRPVSDIEIGHWSTAACQLGNIALRSGERLEWDAAKECIVNHSAANEYLGRKYRKPWDKEARHLPLEKKQLRLLV